MPPSRHVAALPALLLLLAATAADVAAQSVTVITNNSAARSCYGAATRAALRLSVPASDHDDCSRAIDHENLTRSDLAATYINRGIVAVALERYQDAMKDYNAALAVMPRLPEAYISRGNLWFLADKFQRAIDDYTEALHTDFKRPQLPYYNRGLAQERLGNKAAAGADYGEALRIDPGFSQARERLAALNGTAP